MQLKGRPIDLRTVSTALIAAGVIWMTLYTGVTWALAATGPGWAADNSTIVGVQGPADHGKIQAFGPDGDLRWSVSDAASYHDVSRLDDGRVLATYAVDEPERCGPYEPPCARTGVRILAPDPAAGTAHIVQQWSYPVRTIGNSEVHDAEILPSGRVLVVGMDRERLFTVDLSTDDGDVRHIWNASQYYDGPSDPTLTDWLHMNDVDRLGPDRYLVSVRNVHQVLIIEDGAVAEVINKDRDPTVLRGQHNPQWLGEGAVLVSDSSNNRAVELHQTANGTWEPVWAVEGANGLPFAWPRDADRLPNGNTLITDSRNHRVVEVTESGEVVGVLRTAALPYEADDGRERVGGTTYEPRDVAPGAGEGAVGSRALHLAWVGIEHALPVPWWLTEWHLLAFIVMSVLVNFGGALRWWAWVRQEDLSLGLFGEERGEERAQWSGPLLFPVLVISVVVAGIVLQKAIAAQVAALDQPSVEHLCQGLYGCGATPWWWLPYLLLLVGAIVTVFAFTLRIRH